MSKTLNNIPYAFEGLAELAKRQRVSNLHQEPVAEAAQRIVAALDSFGECVRYLNTRRSSGAVLKLESEANVQDVIFLMLRPWILDLTPENPNDKVANTYAIQDFVSKLSRCVIEAKFVRDREHGKKISKEINDDIENYRYHSHCDDLIFFIYDPQSFLPDSASVKAHVTSERQYGQRILRCHAVIKP